MLKNGEMLDYIAKAKEIYSENNKSIIAYAVKYDDGSSKVRLHVHSKIDGTISKPIEVQFSKLGDDIKKLRDFIYLKDYGDLQSIKRTLDNCFPNLPVIMCYKNTGYQRDINGNIISYNGARCYDNAGDEIAKDMFAGLPKFNGDFKKVIEQLNPYMQKNVKRQIVLLHALSGAVCGLVKRNSILVLVGESSRGKSSAMQMGASFFCEPDCEKNVLKWSATQNALVKRMDGLSGVNVLIDDTQLSKVRAFQNIIYSFEAGESYDRLEKGSKLGEKYHWYVSIGITAERSLLDTFEDKGAVGRIIEMTIRGNDLFDDTKEVDAIQKLYTENYGVVGTAFIQKILKNYDEREIKKKVEEEGKEAIEKFKDTKGDTVLARHIEGDIAVMIATAKMANENLGFEFQIQEIQDALVGLCAENRRTFDQNELTEQDIKDIYKDILESAEQQCSQYKRNEEIIVPSPLMKKYISKYIRESKVKAAWIKKEMASHGYLAERNGVYCWSHTINGESLSGYQLFIKKED